MAAIRTISMVAILVGFAVRLATASPPALEVHTTDTLSVALPKAWKVTTTTGAATLFAAQQDPARADAAAMVVSVQLTGNTASEDSLLDMVAAQTAKDLKIARREALPGGGHVLVGDGTAGTVSVRVGAIAFATSGGAILGVLVAKASEFDGLGGVGLVGQVLGSIKPTAPAAAPSPAPAPAPTPASGDKLDTPPSRPLTLADFAGTWDQDSGSIKGYVNSSGGYAGYSAVQTASTHVITAKGEITTKFRGVSTSTGGAGFVSQTYVGTLIVSPNGVIEITNKGHTSTFYVVRGWYQTPELTVVKLAGQFWGQAPADVIADPSRGNHEIWVRKNPKP